MPKDSPIDKRYASRIKSSILVQMIGKPESSVIGTFGKCEPYRDDNGYNVYWYSTQKIVDKPFLMFQVKCSDKRVTFVSIEESMICKIHTKRPQNDEHR